MSAINPTQNTGLIVDEFIRYANAHLITIQGLVDTTSVYPTVPSPTILPGKIFWKGYTVQPTTSSKELGIDDFPAKENVEPQLSKPATTEEEIVIDGKFEDEMDEEIRINSEEDIVIDTKFKEGTPFNIGFRGGGGGGGGFSSGFTGAVIVDLGELDLSAEWYVLAAQYIGKKEGFTPRATWDVDKYRLGFGTGKILGTDGKIRDVRPDKAYHDRTGEKVATSADADTTTVDAALKMLQYEVSATYKKRVVGTEPHQISEELFNALNNKQKAALVSYAYNAGSLRIKIANAIKEGNLSLATTYIKEGPITDKDGVVYDGLIKRRAEESVLFST